MFSHHPEVIDYPPICHHYIHRAWNLINWKKKKKKKKKHNHKSFSCFIFLRVCGLGCSSMCVCVCVCWWHLVCPPPPSSIPGGVCPLWTDGWEGVRAITMMVGEKEGGGSQKMREQEFPSRNAISPQSLQQHTLFTATHAAGSKNRIGPSPHPSSPSSLTLLPHPPSPWINTRE